MCLIPAVVIRSGRPCECVEGARVPRCPPQSGRSRKLGCGRVGLATEIDMHDVVLPPEDIAHLDDVVGTRISKNCKGPVIAFPGLNAATSNLCHGIDHRDLPVQATDQVRAGDQPGWTGGAMLVAAENASATNKHGQQCGSAFRSWEIDDRDHGSAGTRRW
jgi:hypothetical protein